MMGEIIEEQCILTALKSTFQSKPHYYYVGMRVTLSMLIMAASVRDDVTGPKTNDGLMVQRLRPSLSATAQAALSASTCKREWWD